MRSGDIENFKNKRQSKTKRHFDELCDHYSFNNAEGKFKVNLFYRCGGIVNTQINQKFVGMSTISKLFQFLLQTYKMPQPNCKHITVKI